MSITLPTISGSDITEQAMNIYDNHVEIAPSEAGTEHAALYYSALKLPDVVTDLPAAVAPSLSSRQYEINEWTINNRRDTLFVLQLVFVGLCVAAILTGLFRKGFLAGGLYGILVALVLIVIVFTIVRRAQYTEYTRDNRYWNRMKFDKMPGPPVITMPSICPGGIAPGISAPDMGEVATLFRK